MALLDDPPHPPNPNSQPDRIKKAEKRLETNSYDIEAWSVLIRDVQTKRVEDARPFYENLVGQFFNCGRYWKLYIEHELRSRNNERVEKLFHKCLMKVLNIDLWRCYLSYIKETKVNLGSFKEKMAQAYDFALDKIGMDIMSYPIWNDYVNFLKSVEAIGSYAENQRITAVRKVYQRGIVTPMLNIEQLWKDYVANEQNINAILAEKIIADRSRDYMNARRVGKEYEAVTRGLNRNAPSVPPTGTQEETKQVDLWKKYISWEKSNPLKTEDQSLITKRVMFAYEQCLLCLGHHPDIWYEAALFMENSSKILTEKGDLNLGKQFGDDAAQIYERAISTLLKNNMLLFFAYADFEESRMKHEKVHQIYNKFIELSSIDPTLAYIQYMKFARRAEGIKSARTVFKKAREDPRCQHQIYCAAALMEYFCTKDKNIAFKIFELGLKKHQDNPEYILSYIDHLSHLNEDNNTRVLFERVLSSGSLSAEKSVDIWNKFLEFESNIGDLSSIVKVEKRRTGVIEQIKEFEGKETALLVDRYKFMNLFPCTGSELRSLGYMELAKQHVVSLTSASTSKRDPSKMEMNLLMDQKQSFSYPSTQHMIPFKPRQVYPVGAHPVPGGVFPIPSVASHLLTLLPPPMSFQGPFVIIDPFLELLKNCQLPENIAKSVENGIGKDFEKYFEHAINASASFSAESTKKRKVEGDESEEEDNGTLPPVKDIYRSRQKKRVKVDSI